jgi:hypothetical protein
MPLKTLRIGLWSTFLVFSTDDGDEHVDLGTPMAAPSTEFHEIWSRSSIVTVVAKVFVNDLTKLDDLNSTHNRIKEELNKSEFKLELVYPPDNKGHQESLKIHAATILKRVDGVLLNHLNWGETTATILWLAFYKDNVHKIKYKDNDEVKEIIETEVDYNNYPTVTFSNRNILKVMEGYQCL